MSTAMDFDSIHSSIRREMRGGTGQGTGTQGIAMLRFKLADNALVEVTETCFLGADKDFESAYVRRCRETLIGVHQTGGRAGPLALGVPVSSRLFAFMVRFQYHHLATPDVPFELPATCRYADVLDVFELANFMQTPAACSFFRAKLVTMAQQAPLAEVLTAAALLQSVDVSHTKSEAHLLPLPRALWAEAARRLGAHPQTCAGLWQQIQKLPHVHGRDAPCAAASILEKFTSSVLRELYAAYSVVDCLTRELKKLHRDNARFGRFSGIPTEFLVCAGAPTASEGDDNAAVYVDRLATKSRALEITRILGGVANHQGPAAFAKYVARCAVAANNAAAGKGDAYRLGLDHTSYLFQFGLCSGRDLFAGLGGAELPHAKKELTGLHKFGAVMRNIVGHRRRDAHNNGHGRAASDHVRFL